MLHNDQKFKPGEKLYLHLPEGMHPACEIADKEKLGYDDPLNLLTIVIVCFAGDVSKVLKSEMEEVADEP